jgi:hypothetical protein
LDGLGRRKQADTGEVTVVVVEDENFYGNAHLLRRIAEAGKEEGGRREDEG